MLKPAFLFKDLIQEKIAETLLDPRYEYAYLDGSMQMEPKLATNTWEGVDVVSVIEKGKQTILLGLAKFRMDRPGNFVSSIYLLSFTDSSKEILAGDLYSAINKLFTVMNIPKMKWCVAVGNPVEKLYDRLCTLAGGRIVGIFRNDGLTYTRKHVDVKWYEITSKEYQGQIPPKKSVSDSLFNRGGQWTL